MAPLYSTKPPATAVHRSEQDHGNPALQGGEHVMSGLAVGFSPPHPAPGRVTTRGWARDDVLPGINAGVSSATHHILPTPMDCGRMANHADCGRVGRRPDQTLS